MSSFFGGGSDGGSNSSSAAGAAGGRPVLNEKLKPWVERYRPKTLDDVAHQDQVVNALRSTLATGNLPHMLLYGPAGTGKTSTILAVCNELFGAENFSDRVLELNASDERGINVVRTKVKNFASTAVGKRMYKGKQLPPFKLIILDEADSMTHDAQSALRRTMEKYTRVTRFCLICNYVSRIIDPLASRCAKFRFKPLPVPPMQARIQQICVAEQVKCDGPGCAELLKISRGDLRKAITLLQSAARFNNGVVTEDVVTEVSGVMPPKVVQGLWTTLLGGNFEAMEKAVSDLRCEGFCTLHVLAQLQEIVVEAAELNDQQKARLAIELARADKAIEDGADEELQLLEVCSNALMVQQRYKTAA